LADDLIELGAWVLAQDIAVELRVSEVMGITFPIGVLAHAWGLFFVNGLHFSLYSLKLRAF